MAGTPTRKDVAKAMRDMDLCFMSTHGADRTISSRPVSNNAQVDWDGDNWFFSHDDTRKVRELEADPAVTLDFQSRDGWITLQGDAELHRDKALFASHWTKDLDRWFQDGIDTPGLTLIQVRARLAEVNGRMGEGRVDLT
ncbi:pyridoxamine 5'-phosphate oxidase family protein [Paracoccus sphaerophysae]|uniref:pyridoxamine 5'-phosphate oxidase family protein n=1 Tax=Paracoccus sphaerophysae TaxID=690417 RepID=UPI00235286AA|nr:pyridoxamine 5'-phosphate oxidase family protein [Paracoccus sphaerophysae]